MSLFFVRILIKKKKTTDIIPSCFQRVLNQCMPQELYVNANLSAFFPVLNVMMGNLLGIFFFLKIIKSPKKQQSLGVKGSYGSHLDQSLGVSGMKLDACPTQVFEIFQISYDL